MQQDFLNIKVPKGTKIAVVGDIHEHEFQFDEILKQVNPSKNMYFVSVGDVYDKGYGDSVAESITYKLRTMQDQGYGFAIRGNHELKRIKKAKNNLSKSLEWFNTQPTALSFVFDNNNRLTVVHGGLLPRHTFADLKHNTETCYVRDVDEIGKMIRLKWINDKQLIPEKEGGTNWHELYDGRFGYVIAGHRAQEDGIPKYYKHSANIDTSCYSTGKLCCQIYSENGLENLVSSDGIASGWNEEK